MPLGDGARQNTIKNLNNIAAERSARWVGPVDPTQGLRVVDKQRWECTVCHAQWQQAAHNMRSQGFYFILWGCLGCGGVITHAFALLYCLYCPIPRLGLPFVVRWSSRCARTFFDSVAFVHNPQPRLQGILFLVPSRVSLSCRLHASLGVPRSLFFNFGFYKFLHHFPSAESFYAFIYKFSRHTPSFDNFFYFYKFFHHSPSFDFYASCYKFFHHSYAFYKFFEESRVLQPILGAGTRVGI